MTPQERADRISQRREVTERTHRAWCKGTWRDFAIYRVEVDHLQLNVDNRRFIAERQLMEHRLGHSLDPESSPRDLRSLISILLDTSLDVDGDTVTGTPSKDYEALRKDWLKRKQETPFWIRPDGLVRNGNRRLAMIHRLREEEGGDAFDWVDAVFLPPDDIDEGDLFEMEQREQLTENFKVRYTDINLLLTLRDAAIARDIDWADPDDLERVAGELQEVAGGDKSYAAKQLRAIRYMDAYLEDSNAPHQYHKLLRQVERFRDVGTLMARMESYPDQAPDMLRLAFAAVRGGNPHAHIRKLWNIFRDDRDRYDALLAALAEDEEEWETSQQESQLEEPDLRDESEEEDEDAEPPGPSVPNYPREQVRTRIENAVDGFLAASLDAPSILTQALDRLEALTRAEDRIAEALTNEHAEEVRALLDRLIAWADKAREQYTDGQ